MMFMSDVKKKRGRPKKEGARDIRIRCLVSKSEYDFIKNACESSGKTLSELMRTGVMKASSDALLNNFDINEDAEDDDFRVN